MTLLQAKKQLEIASTDTAHDNQLQLLIQAAREQWEHDTDSCVLTQTLTCTAEYLCDGIEIPKRPIQSITSIKYYDTSNVQQTLSTAVYSLDAPRRQIRLKYLQSWPDNLDRWDSILITYVAGYTTVGNVPAIAKQAILLLIAHYFENRDMLLNVAMEQVKAYEMLVRRYQRSTYP